MSQNSAKQIEGAFPLWREGENGLGELLPDIYGVWKRPSQIDYDALPDRFVLKTNHGCGWNIVCHDKEAFDRAVAAKKLNFWRRLKYNPIESHYSLIAPRLFADIAPPANFEAMKEYARILSKEFDFVRVDLYDTGDRVYFGELTFTPKTGILGYLTDVALREMHAKIKE